MDNVKIILNNSRSVERVNKDSFVKISLDNTSRLLPVGDINEIINVGEVFNKERQNSKIYRFNFTINSLFSNVLVNVTGDNSYSTFMGGLFRDRSYPPNGIDLDEDEDLTYKESIETHLIEKDGWFGYYDPDISKVSNCLFYDVNPNRELFSLSPKNNVKNWNLTILYPKSVVSNNLTDDGLRIVFKGSIMFNGREMTIFGTPVKHGLKVGSTVRLKNLQQSIFNVEHQVISLGLANGDDSENYFIIDLNPNLIDLTVNSRMSRIYGGQESKYYYRVFSKIKTKSTFIMENDDYEVYPLAFSKNIYNDIIHQFNMNEDVDISGLVDNLGRPLSEVYFTFIKSDSEGEFSDVKSGLLMPKIDGVEIDLTIPDIRRISNATNSHSFLESGISINDNDFIGDVVEYNKFELKENVLADVWHRFNTNNRDNGGSVRDTVTNVSLSLGNRYEGYMYKAHHLVKIREFSNYIEQGDSSVVDIPDYAEDLGDGRIIWRDLLDIGYNDVNINVLDYPFVNGVHYIHDLFNFQLKRQDPFSEYGLYYKTFPRDGLGSMMGDKVIIKTNNDEC
jgi:hypothetical protein